MVIITPKRVAFKDKSKMSVIYLCKTSHFQQKSDVFLIVNDKKIKNHYKFFKKNKKYVIIHSSVK